MTIREQAAIRWPLEKAFAEGKDIEYQRQDGNWEIIDEPTFHPSATWRIKPETKLRPFKPEEVPVGALFRFGEKDLPKLIIQVKLDNSVFFGSGWRYVNEITYGQYSYDHGKTWLPFGVRE